MRHNNQCMKNIESSILYFTCIPITVKHCELLYIYAKYIFFIYTFIYVCMYASP